MYTTKEYKVKEEASEIESPWVPIPYKVTSKKMENRKLMTFAFEPARQKRIEPIKPGQFNMLYAFGVGEIPISVSSLFQTEHKLVHTIQDVGAVSHAINGLSINDNLGIRGPFGTCWPIENARGKDLIIMAGGVGLCPLRPVIETVMNKRDQFGDVNVLYGTRNPDGIIYHEDIIYWQSDPSVNLLITVDHAFSKWHGNVGVVTHLVNKAKFDPENTVAFVCGPEVMMRFGAYALLEHGISDENIFVSMERNMKCAIGFCGHCQYGPHFICKDGAVFNFNSIKPHLKIHEL
ncbi:MAG: FAD/NAD(P)-binding protein [Bacteroidota bacterium]